jgi:hypothetical protein
VDFLSLTIKQPKLFGFGKQRDKVPFLSFRAVRCGPPGRETGWDFAGVYAFYFL